MKGALLTVGDELLIGQVVNSNAAFVGRALSAAGIDVVRSETVGDERGEIVRGLRDALAAADIVVVTGGLGPTHDDLTKSVLADHFRMPLVRDEAHAGRIAALLASRGIAWNDAAEEQSMVPAGAEILPNRYGTAAGLMIRSEGKLVVVLPGIPYEMAQILTDSVLPRLVITGRVTVHRTLRTAGISESALAARLEVPSSLPGGVRLAFLPSLSGVRLRLDASGASREDAARAIAAAESLIRERGGRYVYGEEEDELETVVGRLLSAAGLTLGCAESCTGGAIARKIVSVPGASSYFAGSVVAYADGAKTSLLGVDAALLRSHGAVSKEAALAMAAGARSVLGTDIGLSATGIAGPSGGTPEKPVGTVWIGYADAAGSIALRQSFGEGRERVVERSTAAALDLLRRKLQKLE